MIEPAKMQCIGVEVGVGTEVIGADAVSPGMMHPGAGDEILMGAGFGRTGLFAQREETVDASGEVTVVPAGDVEGGDANVAELCADVQGGPVVAGRVMFEPVAHVGGKALGVNSWMRGVRRLKILRWEDWPMRVRGGRWLRAAAGGERRP